MDAKDWGLAIKEVVMGIGGAAAGFVGGPAAAAGVDKLDKGLDRMIQGEPAPAKPPRSERFDRADFGARSKAPPAAIPAAEPAPSPAPPAMEAVPETPDGAPAAPVPMQRPGEEGTAADFLSSMGWPPNDVQRILGGPATSHPDRAETLPASAAAVSKGGTFRTFEVYGVQGGHVVPLLSVLDRKDGQWQVRPGAQVRATDRATVGMGLAGAPGKWRDYYPHHQPEQYGLHAGKAVLYWEPQHGRALAASGGLLTQLFGRNWRSTVYRTEEEHG